MKVESWDINKPIPYARNPRVIPQKAVDNVAASIKEFGWRQPVVVDKEGVIIVGHTRLLAARKLNLKEVPVHVATNLTKAQVRAYRLADNRTGMETSWDFDMLAVEIDELKDEKFDIDLLGFSQEELNDMIGTPNFAPGTAEDQGQLDQKKPCTCPECGHVFTV
jgi:ParB family chromosome partitioning protein